MPRDVTRQNSELMERVRKLEVMPQSRTIPAAKWRPTYDDLYAIAGHIYMMGCYPQPWQTSTGFHGANPANVWQASHYLWATLDNRGFASVKESQQWTRFLKAMGALPTWDRYRAGHLEPRDPPLVSPALEECRPQRDYGPWVYSGYKVGGPSPDTPGPVAAGDRALYWDGLPNNRNGWDWLKKPELGDGLVHGVTLPWDQSAYWLWDGTGPYDVGIFKDPNDYVVYQKNFWTTNTSGDPTPEQIHRCGDIDEPYDDSPGLPVTYEADPRQCPGYPPGTIADPFGTLIKVMLVIGAHDLSLIAPPRFQSPDAGAHSDYSHPILTGSGEAFPDGGPGLDWLADGVDTLLDLDDFSTIKRFYESYLPIAFNHKLRAQHHNWEQLQVSVHVRGRVEARREPDRVILKGGVYIPGETVGSGLFGWPPDWPSPFGSTTATAFLAHDDRGRVVPFDYDRNDGGAAQARTFRINHAWALAEQGPMTVSFDGVVIPLPLPT